MLKNTAKQVVRAFGFDVINHRPYHVDGVTAGKIVTWKCGGKELSGARTPKRRAMQGK
jgi:hypothetical protein